MVAQWEQTAGPCDGDIQDLIRHKDKIWAATSGGLYFTPNEANHWQYHPAIKREYIIFDLQEHNGMLFAYVRGFDSGWSSYKSWVYRSENDGETWDNIAEIPFSYVITYRLASINGKLFLIDGSKVWRSPDNGLNWVDVSLPVQYGEITNDASTALCYDYYEGLFISEDGMDSWQQIADSSDNFGPVHVVKGNIIISERYFGGGGKHFSISHDLGQTWDSFPQPPQPPSFSLSCYDGGGDTILGVNDKIYQTTDFGANWYLWGNSTGGIIPDLLTPYGAIGGDNRTVWKFRYNTGFWEKADKGLTSSFIGELKANTNTLFAKTSSGFYATANAGENWSEINRPVYATSSNRFDVSNDTLYWGAYRVLYVATGNGSSGWDTLANNVSNSYPEDLSVQGNKIIWTRSHNIFLIDRATGDIDTLALPSGANESNHFLRILGSRYVYTDNNGDAYISDNSGAGWTKTLEQNVPGNNSGNQLFYLLGRLFLCTKDGINISTDNGTSWHTPTTPPQFQFDINGMTSVGNLLLLTAPYIGVYISTDLGQNWQPYNTGLGNLYGFSMASLDDHIFLGTYGSSVWRRIDDLSLLTGIVYSDDNNNGIREWDEAPFPDVIVHTSPSNLFSVSQFDGAYSAYANIASDTLRIVPFTPYATVNPPYYLADQSGTSDLDFGIHVTPGIKDLEVVLTNNKPFSPGFPTKLIVTCRNTGTVAQEPIVTVSLDSVRLFFTNATPTPDSFIDFHTFTWKLPWLNPFENTNIEINAHTWPGVSLGDTVTVNAAITPDDADEAPLNNHDLLREVVIGSYDPNDKQVKPEESISPAQIAAGERLTYIIRFQNTGTSPAVFVRIVDTLSQHFDISSLQILAASHPFSWSLRGQNVLEFYFEDIALPDSGSNEPASHGFVKYSIRPNPNLPSGTLLPNKALIFFDFNAPVVTNTTKTNVVLPTLASEPHISHSLLVIPNPANEFVTIQRASDKPGYFTLQDINGRTVLSMNTDSQTIKLFVRDLPQGIYHVSVREDKSVQSGILLIQR